ncbi:MAG: hypothetical protein D6731_15835 [Planctomycetota bacterium]|nr:MAG: hypothetical protein D6731_15835 [Planctomycetota bacterium]
MTRAKPLPLVGLGAGSLLALLAILLSLASSEVLKTARYDDCSRQADLIAQRFDFALRERLQRLAARGERPDEVAAAWWVDQEGAVLRRRPAAAPEPPGPLLAVALRRGGEERALDDGARAAHWIPAHRLANAPEGAQGALVLWDAAVVRARLLSPLLDAGTDYRVALLRGGETAAELGFRPRGVGRPSPPFASWQIGVGLADSGATRRALRAQAWLLAGLSAWLFLVLAGSIGLHLRRERARERARGERERFLARAAHELQTPLALLRAAAESIRGGAVREPDDLRRCVDIVLREEERLTRTVRRLLKHLRREVDPDAPLELGDLAEEVERVCADHRAALAAQGLRLEWRLPGAGSSLSGPRELLGDALAEFLGNARKHARGATRIRVELSAPRADCARLVVADDGSGPSTSPDFGGDEVPGGAEGGLGLVLVREGVQAAGGKLSLGKAAEGGLEVVLELPARAVS